MFESTLIQFSSIATNHWLSEQSPSPFYISFKYHSIFPLNSQTSNLSMLIPSPTTHGFTPKHFPLSGYTLVVTTVLPLIKTSITLTS